jgi:Flp pilus assembly protein TadD
LWAVHGHWQALEANQLGLGWRVGNALVSYYTYIGQFFFPWGLTPHYPRRAVLPPWQVATAAVTLIFVTTAVSRWWRQSPDLFVGWLWYLGMFLPTIGLVQVGVAAEADRFTYLPQIGLAIGLVWGVAEACRARPPFRRVAAAMAAAALVVLAVAAWRQTSFWRDSETLWRHALDCTPRDILAHNHLGDALVDRGKVEEAIVHFQQALQIYPNYASAHAGLGIAAGVRGETDAAIAHFRRALEINPHDWLTHNNLGLALAAAGHSDEAIAHFQTALQINPSEIKVRDNLNRILNKRP